jgi:Uma2 family endonuclease
MSPNPVEIANDPTRGTPASHLPEAAEIERLEAPTVLQGVTYGMYVRLRKDPGNDHYRMTYYDGTLELISPELRHERPSQKLGVLVRAVAATLHIPYLSSGSTTICRGEWNLRKGKGKEPDQSFYFGYLDAVADKETIDLEVDPPPDLWIEVDNRGSSKGRLPVYAELGVPEVWRYKARSGKIWFGRLDGKTYVPIDRSLSLPMLSPELVVYALSRCGRDEGAWFNWLRAWVEAGMPTDPLPGGAG